MMKLKDLENKEEIDILEKKGKISNLKQIGVNLLLSLISVYLFEYWFDKVMTLESLQLAENLGVVGLVASMFFVGKTFYTKGVWNNFKQITIMIFLGAAALGLMLLSLKSLGDAVYPASGILLVGIAFYMISLSSGTLNLVGIAGLALIFATPISIAKWFGHISWSTTGELAQFAIFVILFLGGTWAHIRAYLHGVRGTNKDGGGYGGDNNGDAGDGDGDTGDE